MGEVQEIKSAGIPADYAKLGFEPGSNASTMRCSFQLNYKDDAKVQLFFDIRKFFVFLLFERFLCKISDKTLFSTA